MFTAYCAYLALTVCLLGTLWRIGRWFRISIGPEAREWTFPDRLVAGTAAAIRTLCSRNGLSVLGTLATDVVLQRRIFRQSRIRWIMHMGLFYGFVLLIALHALGDTTLAPFVENYAATRNPYMFLRNLLGFLALTGLTIALARRRTIPLLKRFNTRADKAALLLCALILMSGMALEAAQIISEPLFDEMVTDYMGGGDPEATIPLKAYWAQYFGVAFRDPPPANASILAAGREIHEDYCAACHSRPTAALLAYPLAKAFKPMAGAIERLGLESGLWHFHFLVSCLALALLPFSKFFHILSVPVSLAMQVVGPADSLQPPNRPTRRAVGLDACTHCGICSRHCSVAPIMAVIDNPCILPSEKIGDVRRSAQGKLSASRLWILSQGANICTACGICTQACPSGIDLQDLWQASGADLARQGFLPPHARIGGKPLIHWAEVARSQAQAGAQTDSNTFSLGLADKPETFWACVQCTICTNVCPVVAASDNPRQDLDFTPQQVMNLMRLELKQMALGCGMVWKCVTCYKCQEHCPQGVPVADVLYELRNDACRWLVPAQAIHDEDEAGQ